VTTIGYLFSHPDDDHMHFVLPLGISYQLGQDRSIGWSDFPDDETHNFFVGSIFLGIICHCLELLGFFGGNPPGPCM
jgi:hypothetical protein